MVKFKFEENRLLAVVLTHSIYIPSKVLILICIYIYIYIYDGHLFMYKTLPDLTIKRAHSLCKISNFRTILSKKLGDVMNFFLKWHEK